MEKEKIINSVIDSLTLNSPTLKKIRPDAYSVLTKSFEEVYEYVKKEGFKADLYFKQNFSRISEKRGLLDAGLSFLILATFSAGFAAGKGRKEIEPEDVFSTREWGCDYWPACPEMRIEGFLKSLSMLMEWYDTYIGKTE